MKRYIQALWFVTVTALLMTSCLGSESTDTSNYYTDTAITAFRLTTVNQYVHHTTSAGTDSISMDALTNPAVFTIDQYSRKIYNTDSLPAGCDLSHIVATITCKNSGTIVIKSVNSDTLKIYNSSDSIDFSQPREIRVYSQNGAEFRAYEVTVNVQKAESSPLKWEKMDPADLPVDARKAEWEAHAEAAGLLQFIGAGTTEAYAFDTVGRIMVTKDNGQTWAADSLDDDSALLPSADNFAFATWEFAANDSTDYQLLVGTSEQQGDYCTVWRKIADYSTTAMPSKWVRITPDGTNVYLLPKMDGITLARYNGIVLAAGDDGNLYVSRDQGITWKKSSDYALPSSLTSNHVTLTTDADGNLWLTCPDTGEVWRGQTIR